MQGAFDGVPLKLAPGEGRPLMAALVFEGVICALDIDQQHSFSVNGHPLHLARLEVRKFADGDVLSHVIVSPKTDPLRCPASLSGREIAWDGFRGRVEGNRIVGELAGRPIELTRR